MTLRALRHRLSNFSAALPKFGRTGVTVVVLCAACSSDAVEVSSPDLGQTPAELHLLSEEAVRECMALEGFEYEMVPYFNPAENRETLAILSNLIFLSESDESGYGIVLGDVLIRTTPTGEPDSDLSASEVQAYDEALFGEDYLFREEGDPIQGCRRAGLEAVPETRGVVELEPQLADEFLERLTASNAFIQFNSAWSACLEKEGFEAASSVEEQYDVVARALDPALSEALEDDELVREIESQLSGLGVIDLDLFEASISSTALQEVLAEERRMAGQDRSCRERSRSILEVELERLSQEIFERPFGSF